MTEESLYFEPYHYNIRESEQENGKSVHIKITPNSGIQDVIFRQTTLIKKLKDERNRYISTIEERNFIIKQMIEKMKEYEGRIGVFAKVILENFGEEYLNGLFGKEVDPKVEANGYETLNKIKILEKANQDLRAEIKKLKESGQGYSQGSNGNYNAQLIMKIKNQNSELTAKLEKLKQKYKRAKKDIKETGNFINDIQTIEIEEETVQMYEVQCQTQPISTTPQQQVEEPKQQKVVSRKLPIEDSQQENKDQIISGLQQEITKLKKKLQPKPQFVQQFEQLKEQLAGFKTRDHCKELVEAKTKQVAAQNQIVLSKKQKQIQLLKQEVANLKKVMADKQEEEFVTKKALENNKNINQELAQQIMSLKAQIEARPNQNFAAQLSDKNKSLEELRLQLENARKDWQEKEELTRQTMTKCAQDLASKDKIIEELRQQVSSLKQKLESKPQIIVQKPQLTQKVVPQAPSQRKTQQNSGEKDKTIADLKDQIDKLKKKQQQLIKLKEANKKLTSELQQLQFEEQVIQLFEVECQTDLKMSQIVQTVDFSSGEPQQVEEPIKVGKGVPSKGSLEDGSSHEDQIAALNLKVAQLQQKFIETTNKNDVLQKQKDQLLKAQQQKEKQYNQRVKQNKQEEIQKNQLIIDLRSQIADLKQKSESIGKLQAKVTEAETQAQQILQKNEAALSQKDALISNLQNQIGVIKSKTEIKPQLIEYYQQLKQQLTDLKRKQNQISKLTNEVQVMKASLEPKPELTTLFEQIGQQLSLFKKHQPQIEEAQEKVRQIAAEHQVLIQQKEKIIKQLEKEISKLKDELVANLKPIEQKIEQPMIIKVTEQNEPTQIVTESQNVKIQQQKSLAENGQLLEKDRAIADLKKQITKLKKKERQLQKLKQANRKLSNDLETLQFEQEVIQMSQVQCQTDLQMSQMGNSELNPRTSQSRSRHSGSSRSRSGSRSENVYSKEFVQKMEQNYEDLTKQYQTQNQSLLKQLKINSQLQSQLQKFKSTVLTEQAVTDKANSQEFSSITQLHNQIEQKEKKIKELEGRIEYLNKMIAEVREESDNIMKSLAQQNTSIQQREISAEERRLENEMSSNKLQSSIQLRDREIKNMDGELKKVKEFVRWAHEQFKVDSKDNETLLDGMERIKSAILKTIKSGPKQNSLQDAKNLLQITDLNNLPLLYIENPYEASSNIGFQPIFISHQNIVTNPQAQMTQQSGQPVKEIRSKPNLQIQVNQPPLVQLPLMLAPSSPKNNINFTPLMARTEPYSPRNTRAESEFLVSRLKQVQKSKIENLLKSSLKKINKILTQVQSGTYVKQENIREITNNVGTGSLTQLFKQENKDMK